MTIEYDLTASNRTGLNERLDRLDPTVIWHVSVKPKKSKRSSEQNSRYWKLLTDFGKHLGYGSDEMHDICRFKFLRNAIEIEGEKFPLLKTTTKLTTAQMVDYQDAIERWAASMGFVFDDV
ncbi:MAG: recombination protein NinB [Pseudomonadota bacterium]